MLRRLAESEGGGKLVKSCVCVSVCRGLKEGRRVVVVVIVIAFLTEGLAGFPHVAHKFLSQAGPAWP